MRKILCFIVIFVSIFFNLNLTQTNAEDFIPSSNPIVIEAFTSNIGKTNGSDFQHYARAKFKNEIVFLNFHVKDQLSVPENETRWNRFYKQNITPTVFVNGIYNYPGSMLYNDEIEKAIKNKQYPIKLKIEIESNQVNIKIKTSERLSELNLVVLVYEDEVWSIVNNPEKDYFHRYLVRKMLTTANGDFFTIQPDLLISRKYKLSMKLNRQMGIVAFIQNPNTKVIYGSAHIKISDQPTTTFFWNEYNPNSATFDSPPPGQYVFLHTGYDFMTFKADKPNHLKTLNISLDTYTLKTYILLERIIPTIPNTKIEFSKNAGTILITFPEEINNDKTVDLFKLVVKCITATTDTAFPVYKLFANDSGNNPIGWEYIELKIYYLNEISILSNPLDLNEDYIVDKHDLDEIIYEFGQLSKDKSYDPKYDVFPPALSLLEEDRDKHGDGRIDIQDVILVERETWIYDPPKS